MLDCVRPEAATPPGRLAAARPLWVVSVVLGLVVVFLAVFSTSARAMRSAERLAPLIEDRRIEDAHVA